MKIEKFEDLPIWKNSLIATKLIYDLSSNLEFSKDFGLKDQIRRAVVSISSNIVEGYERFNNNEFIRFLKIAKGSCGEVRNQLHIGFAVGYISKEDFDKSQEIFIELSKQIFGFINYLENRRKNNDFIRK